MRFFAAWKTLVQEHCSSTKQSLLPTKEKLLHSIHMVFEQTLAAPYCKAYNSTKVQFKAWRQQDLTTDHDAQAHEIGICEAASKAEMNDAGLLPADDFITPSDFDVICCKGNLSTYHAGNVRLQSIVRSHVAQYNQARTKTEKSKVVSCVLSIVRNQGNKGRFIRKDPVSGLWKPATSRFAREKIGQLFRNSLPTQYRSSSQAKKRRRNAISAGYDACLAEVVQSNDAVNHELNSLANRLTRLRVGSDCGLTKARDVEAMFTEMNCRILTILKESNAVAKVSSMFSLHMESTDDSHPVE